MALDFRRSETKDFSLLQKVEKNLSTTGWIAKTLHPSSADFVWSEVLRELSDDLKGNLGTNTSELLLKLQCS